MLTERQEKLLYFLIREYVSSAEPVSSLALKHMTHWDVSSATIRNDLQVLTKEGYIEQPHTSAGRVPTKKAYRHFADKAEEEQKQKDEFIVRQVRMVHVQIEQDMRMMQEIMETLEKGDIFEILTILEKWRKI